MLTGAPPSDRVSVSPAPRRRVWPWAAGSILIPLLVIAATLVGQRVAARARLASEVAPAPALPPLTVAAVAHAPGQVISLALDSHTQTLVAQVVGCQTDPLSMPAMAKPGGCLVDAHTLSALAFYNSITGAPRGVAMAPLLSSPSSAQPIALTDATHGLTYLINNGVVTIYDDATGKPTGSYTSPLIASAQGYALDGQAGLIYAVTINAFATLNALDAATGQIVASASLPAPSAAGVLAPEMRVDASAGRVYVFNGNAMGPVLYGFNASDLTPLGSWSFAGRLGAIGPLDSATHTLYVGSSQLDLSTLPADGAGEQVTPVQTVQAAVLSGASHFGVDGATGALVLMTHAGVEAFAANAMQPYAALPLVQAPIAYGAQNPPWLLPIDSQAGRIYLPGDDNTLLIVSLARPSSYAAPNALTAVIVARAGMASLLPNTNQNPPFADAHTFPLTAGTAQRVYYIYYADLGWKGPYSGYASIGDVRVGATPGDYTMTFTLAWDQLFLRQHSWQVELTPDGRAYLLGDSGDGLP